MNVIQHNMNAMFADRQLSITTGIQAKSSEKLSSGYRINRAADDAAGLSMSEKMRRQIRGLTQASKNAQDGVSLLQIADGAMHEDHEMLQRMNELAVKAANGTLQTVDREYIDSEVQKLKEEISAISSKTTFNELSLFPENGYSPNDDSEDDENVLGYQDFNISIGKDGKFTVSASDPMTADANMVNKVAAADGWQKLAKKIADVMIPNAVGQILGKFDAFTKNGDSDNINVALRVEYIDGPNGTLAYAQFGYKGSGMSAQADKNSFLVKVDSKDFSDKSLTDNKALTELESTIQHELMHTVMQNTMTGNMVGDFPKWFKEGTAQLAGGGFTTGWNDYLVNLVNGKSYDAVKDDLKNALKQYTVENREYGHGYLAAAYLGWKASGSATVDANSIASGMNEIFKDIINNGHTLDQAIAAQSITGISNASAVANAINTASDDATRFVYDLITNANGGAGSVVASDGLSATGDNIITGDLKGDGNYTIDPNVNLGGKKLILQVGSENSENDRLSVKMFKMSAKELGLEDTNVLTQADAQNAISDIKEALRLVSKVRSYYGATQNRLEHTINNLNNIVENTTASESLIRDTDMSEEMVRYSNNNILAQAGQSMLAQANQSNQGTLSLLGR